MTSKLECRQRLPRLGYKRLTIIGEPIVVATTVAITVTVAITITVATATTTVATPAIPMATRQLLPSLLVSRLQSLLVVVCRYGLQRTER